MARVTNPTWVLGDGALKAVSLNVLVRRQANKVTTSKLGSSVQVHDTWIISFDHDDGCGRMVSTNIQLSQLSSPAGKTVSVNAITNDLGKWRTSAEFDGINLDDVIKPNGAFQVANFPLLIIIQNIYNKAKKLCHWKDFNGSPLENDAPEGTILFSHFEDVHMPLFDPKLLCFADVNQTLVEIMGNDYGGLAMRMNASQFLSNRYIEDALRIRYESIAGGNIPAGVSIEECIGQLVKAGLYLGVWQYEENFIGDNSRVSGTTSLMSKAVEANRIDLVEALMQNGADALLPTYRQVDGIRRVSSPLLDAALSDNFSAVVAIMNHLTPQDAQLFCDAIDEKKLYLSREVAAIVHASQARHCVKELLKPRTPSPI